MICVLCGMDISRSKQKPVPIARLEFRPYIGQAEPGQDNIYGAEACQACYQKVLANRSNAIAEFGRIKEDNDAH